MKYRFLNALIVVGIVSGTMTAAHAADDWTNVINAAKKEGTVSVYHAQLGAPHWKAVVKAFEDKYGIQVQEIDARASELTERIRVEQTSGRYIADVEFHGEATIVQQRQTDFVAEHGEVPNMHNLRPPFVADNWAIPAWVQVVCTLVNTNMVPPQSEPKNWSDFLDPKWKGEMLSDDLSAIGSGSTMFTALYKAYGRPYLEKLIAQHLTIGRDLQQDTQRVARGEYPVFLQQIVAFASGLNGLPVKIVVPADGCPYTLIEGAVLRGAPHPNAARLFINHLLDMDSQITYAKAWMGTTIVGVADRLTDPDAKRFADAKLLGTVKPEDRDPMQKLATEMFK